VFFGVGVAGGGFFFGEESFEFGGKFFGLCLGVFLGDPLFCFFCWGGWGEGGDPFVWFFGCGGGEFLPFGFLFWGLGGKGIEKSFFFGLVSCFENRDAAGFFEGGEILGKKGFGGEPF